MGKKAEKECTECNDNCCFSCLKTEGDNLFQSLSEDELKFLMDDKLGVCFKPGETILKQNTSTTHVICVKQGIAKVYIEGINGKNLILKIIGKNDFITGGGIFENSIRHFTVTAISQVNCCFISADKLLKLFAKNNAFAIELLKHHNTQNNHNLNSLVNLTQKYMPGRVADSLLYLKNNIFKTNPFSMPLSRQELAEMSAMTKESYVRILKEFKTSGIVRPNGNSIEILNEEALMEISKNG